MAAKTKKEKMEEQFAGIFQGMTPLPAADQDQDQDQDHGQEPATDQDEPKPVQPKRRGRPKKTAAAADPTPQEAPEATKKTTAKKTERDTVEAAKPKKSPKSPHSVWCSDEAWGNLLLNCAIRGVKVTDATQEMIEEYLEKHKPKTEQKRNYRQKELERLNRI